MSILSAFLAENAEQVKNVKYIVSKRFKDENGEPVEWEIRCITSTEDEALRKACTTRVTVHEKRGMYTQETDYNRYLGKLAACCTVFPVLTDAELQDSYGVMGEDTLLKTMLTPGEYAEYLNKIQAINGFDISFMEKVAEVKN